MKKLILSVLMFIGITSMAESNYDRAKRELEEILAAPTPQEMRAKARKNARLFNNLYRFRDLMDLRLEYDVKLAEKGLYWSWPQVSSYPKMSELSRKQKGLDIKMTNSVAIAKKYGVDLTPFGVLKAADLTPDEIVTVFNDFVQNTHHVRTEWLSILREYFSEHGADIAEDYLKNNNKYTDGAENTSFDTYINAISSPYYSKMNDWLESVGVTTKIVDLSKIWTPDAIASLKAKILRDELPLNESNRFKLQMCLGLDEYNKFIDEYTK